MATIKFGNADNIDQLIFGDDNIITAGNGTGDFLQVAGNGDQITVGNGAHDEVDIRDTSNSIVVMGDGFQDTVNLFGSRGAHVTVGNGDQDSNGETNPEPIDNDVITFGNGNGDFLGLLGSGNVVTMGNGNGDVVQIGDNNIVTLGNGNNDEVVSDGVTGNTITVGNGNDIIVVGHNDTIKVGTGQDTFQFVEPFTQIAPGGIGNVTITGFNPSKDVIVLQQALETTNPHIATDDGHGNTVINFQNGDTQDHITLVGVHSSALHASNFQFV